MRPEMLLPAQVMFAVGLAAGAVWDARVRRIPNWLNLSLFSVGLLVRASLGGLGALGLGIAGAAVGGLLLVIPFYVRWIGGADVKFAAAAGAWLGPEDAFLGCLLGMAGTGVLGGAMAALGGQKLRQEVSDNLKAALLTQSVPSVQRRAKGQTVPMAVALALAYLGLYLWRGRQS